MMLTRKEVHLGEMLPPWYYGISYQDWASDVYFFYPIPFNYLVRWARNSQFYWNKFRSQSPTHQWVKMDDIHKDMQDSWMRGFDAGEKSMVRDMRKALNANG